MAKAKPKRQPAKKQEPGVTGIAKTPEEIQNARNKVTNVIVDGSVEMTKRVVQLVSAGGNITGLRYLWEVAGMFPAAPGAESGAQESVAKSLLEKLGLYEELPGDEAGLEGDVESKESQKTE